LKTDIVIYNSNQYIDGKEVPQMEYNFNFVRKVDGVLYEENSINVGFNNRNGKMQNFSCRWQDDMAFPEVGKIITEEEAKDTLFKFHEVELAYNRYNKNND